LSSGPLHEEGLFPTPLKFFDTGQNPQPFTVEDNMTQFTLIIGSAPGDEFFVGANKKKPKPGEELLFIEKPLLDPITNVRVGSFNARLKVMRNSGGNVLFSNNADNELAGGVISTQGPLRTNVAKNVFAIVGGTGQFDHAQGTVTIQQVGGKEQATFDVS
jgi:hypothetical protein